MLQLWPVVFSSTNETTIYIYGLFTYIWRLCFIYVWWVLMARLLANTGLPRLATWLGGGEVTTFVINCPPYSSPQPLHAHLHNVAAVSKAFSITWAFIAIIHIWGAAILFQLPISTYANYNWLEFGNQEHILLLLLYNSLTCKLENNRCKLKKNMVCKEV